MNIMALFFFAISSNIDNLFVGISYGIKKIHVSFTSNVIVSLITFVGTVISMFVGKSIARFMSTDIANILGGVMLILIGVISIIKYVKSLKKHNLHYPIDCPEKYDENHNNEIELKEALLLGLALSINNIGIGVAGSISGLKIIPASISSCVLSVLFLIFGNFFGNNYFSNAFGEYAEIFSGVIIITLGVVEVFF